MAVLVTEHGTYVGFIPENLRQPKEIAPKAVEPQAEKPKAVRAKKKEEAK